MKELELEIDKQKLTRLRNKIIGMKECKAKALLINNYRIYSHYVYQRTQDDQFANRKDEFEDCPSYVRYMKTFFKNETDLYECIDILGNIFTVLGKFNENEGIYQPIKINDYINEQLGFELIEEFFSSLSPYIYKLYREIMQESIAYLDLGNAYSCDIAYYNHPKIISYNNMKNYETYKALVHEIGHCYQFILNSKSNNTFFDQIDVEMPALFMETIFNLYVQDKLYGKNYGLNSLLTRQSLLAYTSNVHRLWFNSCENHQVHEQAVYGDLFFDKLTDNDLRLLEYVYGHEIIPRHDFFTFGMEINTFKYTISNLLALKFVDIYLQDQKEGLNQLKDYLMLPPSVTLKDKIADYQIDSYRRINQPIYEHGRKIHRL